LQHFYTIWLRAGAARQLIFDAVEYIRENKKEIQRFVTLSPKTIWLKVSYKMAIVFRDNPET
jgi:cellobiose-specific phosphotransferase system component IIA